MPTPVGGTDTSDNATPVRQPSGALAANPWPVNWSSIWVGVLAALAVALVFGLAAIAVGAHQVGPAGRSPTTGSLGLAALIFSVFGAFISFVVGGWVAGKINGYRHAETDMLHGAVVWLVALPILVVFAALGAGNFFGTWFGGLAGSPVFVSSSSNVGADPNAAAAARNAALGAITGLLIALIGSVIGGWMASGEPMTLTYYRTRAAHQPDGMAAPHRAM